MKNLIAAFTLAVMCMLGSHGFAQANVNEYETNVLYVNPATGSDSHSGTQSSPLRTIQAAVSNAIKANYKGIGTLVMLEAGTYHEDVQFYGYASYHNTALTIQAVTPGTAIVDGSDPVHIEAMGSGGVYIANYDDTVGGCPLPANWPNVPAVALANQMVFVNGQPYTQVMSYSQLHYGTFYVDEANHELHIKPFAGVDLFNAHVEATARRQMFHTSGSHNLVLRGITFEHGASCMNTSSVTITSGSNILLDNVTANWNNFGGIDLAGVQHVTVKNSTADYNGGVGINPVTVQEFLLTNSGTSYNGWRTAQVGFYDFGMGGTKFFTSHGVTVNGLNSIGNQGEGLWFDTGNEHVTVENSLIVGNLLPNLKLEASEGPFTVTHNALCYGGVGVLLTDGASASVKGNLIYGNYTGQISEQNGQIYLAGKTGGRTYYDPLNHSNENSENTNDTIEDNTVIDTGAGQRVFSTYLSGSEWSTFIRGVISDDNTWFDVVSTTPFGIPGGKTVSLPGWQAYTTQDKNSIWSPTSAQAACQVNAPSYPDFAIRAYDTINYEPTYRMSRGSLTIPLQAQNYGHRGSFALSVEGLPSGVTASFGSTTMTSGTTTLKLTASKTAKYQTVPITIFATSVDRVHTITLNIAVTPS